jgi:hypothetical protein
MIYISSNNVRHPVTKTFTTLHYTCQHFTSSYLTLSDPMLDLVQHYDFPVPDTFPHVVQTLAN